MCLREILKYSVSCMVARSRGKYKAHSHTAGTAKMTTMFNLFICNIIVVVINALF